MTVKFNPSTFFRYLILHAFDKASEKSFSPADIKAAKLYTILLGIPTLGLMHLFCRLFLYKPEVKDQKNQVAKTNNVAKNVLPEKPTVTPAPVKPVPKPIVDTSKQTEPAKPVVDTPKTTETLVKAPVKEEPKGIVAPNPSPTETPKASPKKKFEPLLDALTTTNDKLTEMKLKFDANHDLEKELNFGLSDEFMDLPLSEWQNKECKNRKLENVDKEIRQRLASLNTHAQFKARWEALSGQSHLHQVLIRDLENPWSESVLSVALLSEAEVMKLTMKEVSELHLNQLIMLEHRILQLPPQSPKKKKTTVTSPNFKHIDIKKLLNMSGDKLNRILETQGAVATNVVVLFTQEQIKDLDLSKLTPEQKTVFFDPSRPSFEKQFGWMSDSQKKGLRNSANLSPEMKEFLATH